MAEAELQLVRHAEAVDVDSQDPGLSAPGRDQARALGERLRHLSYARLLHSPRARARETAEVLAELFDDVTPEECELLDDRTPFPSAATRDEYPLGVQSWLEHVPANERDEDACVLSVAVSQLASEAVAASAPLLLVTHGFVIGWFVRAALDAPTWRWVGLNSANTGITTVRYLPDGTALLVAFNDTGHLGGRWAAGRVSS
jgi:serine/threonine-protein phosphatase PGAM5